MGDRLLLVEGFDDCNGETMLFAVKKCLEELDNAMLLSGKTDEHLQIKKCLMLVDKLLPANTDSDLKVLFGEEQFAVGVGGSEQIPVGDKEIRLAMMKTLFKNIGENILGWWC